MGKSEIHVDIWMEHLDWGARFNVEYWNNENISLMM